MFKALSRMPAERRKAVGGAMLPIAGFVAIFGLLAVMSFSQAEESSGALWWKETREIPMRERLPDLLIGIGLLAVALVMVVVSIRLMTWGGHLAKYRPILTGIETMPVQRISGITNTKPSKVYKDIQHLIDSGEMTDLYIDYEHEQVVSKRYVPKNSFKTVVTCEGCGGRNEMIVGIPRGCDFCGTPLSLSRRRQT